MDFEHAEGLRLRHSVLGIAEGIFFGGVVLESRELGEVSKFGRACRAVATKGPRLSDSRTSGVFVRRGHNGFASYFRGGSKLHSGQPSAYL